MYQGKQLREVRTTERIIESGKVTEAKTEETTPPVKPEPKDEKEKEAENGVNNWLNHKAKYTGRE
jgi:hypothetical protein